MSRYVKVEDIMEYINTDNRGNCDYFIVDRIEELCNSDKIIDLSDHDKQIRDEIINEFVSKLKKISEDCYIDNYCGDAEFTLERVIDSIAEQIKGE